MTRESTFGHLRLRSGLGQGVRHGHAHARARSRTPGAALAAGLVAWSLLLLGGQAAVAGSGKCPNLTILLDQSASMQQDPMGVLQPKGSPNSKWAIATASLTKLNNRFDGLLPIGYSNFPSADNGCMTQGLRIPVGYGNRVAINYAMIDYPFQGGSSPQCDAIKKLAAEPLLKDPSRGQYVLLVTDGAPAVDCCGADPVQTTVDAITAALQQSPPIYTIVVGFGDLQPSEQMAMNRMALAGGYPDSTDPNYKYFRADSPTSLDDVLNRILMQIRGGDAGQVTTCEDGCYGTPCPSGQVCLQNACKPNPCAGKTCPADQSCQADGSCAPVCVVTCPANSRCEKGRCIADPCSGTCTAGQICDNATGRCAPDPKCANVTCHYSQGCVNGACVDNPCVYLTCPSGYSCIDFDGSCEVMSGSGSDGSMASGCALSAAPRSASLSALAAAALVLCALSLRRRRETAARRRS